MVNAQEWLDQNYPIGERKNIIKLDISDKKLEGSLTIDGNEWSKLQQMQAHKNQIVSAQFLNCQQLVYVEIWANKLATINANNCPQISYLNVTNNLLTNLNLTQHPSLTWFYCDNNQLTNLDFSSCPKMTALWCSSNQLTNANFLTTLLHKEKLTQLIIHNNKINEDLNFLRNFVGLEILNLKMYGISSTKFHGSLKSLENMKKLKELSIQNTDISDSLEYLQTSLEKVYCTGKLAERMKNFKNSDDSHNYQAWRRSDHIQKTEAIKSFVAQIEIPPKN